MKALGGQLFDIANKTSQSFYDVAAAAEEFSRQGLGLEDTLKAVSAASSLAKLSGTDLKSSINGLVAVMGAFSEQALEYKEIVNTLASVDTQFATSAAGLVEGLKRVASVASSAGVSMEDTAAAIASIKQITGRTEAVIGNGLKTIITNFRTESVGEELQKIGVYTKDSEGNFRDLISVIGETEQAFGRLSAQAAENISLKIAGKYQINNFKGLLKAFNEQGGGSLFERAQSSARPDEGLAQKRIDLLNNTTESRVKKLDNSVTQLGAGLGDQVLKPAYDKTIEFLTTITDSLNKFGQTAAPILKGFADALSGPALLVGGAALVSLFFKLSKEVAGALASVLNFNKAESQTAAIQSAINQALATGDKLLVDQVRNATTLQQRTAAINALLRESISIQSGARMFQYADAGLVNSSNKRAIIRNKASGFIPKGFEEAFAREQIAINEGVGGASSSAKPVLRRLNLNGKIEPVVVNTDETIVKNFMGSGKDSVLNKQMLKKLGTKANYLGEVQNLAIGQTPLAFDSRGLKELENAIKQLERFGKATSAGGFGTFTSGVSNSFPGMDKFLKRFRDRSGNIDVSRFTESSVRDLASRGKANPYTSEYVGRNFAQEAIKALKQEALVRGDVKVEPAIKTAGGLNKTLFGNERRAAQFVEKSLGINLSSFTPSSLSGNSQTALQNRNQLRTANELIIEKKRELDVTRAARIEAFNKLQQDTRLRLQDSLKLANTAAGEGFLTQAEKRRILEESAKSAQGIKYTTGAGTSVTGSGGGKLSVVDRAVIGDILRKEAPSSFSNEAKKLEATIAKAIETSGAKGKILRPAQIRSLEVGASFSGSLAQRDQFFQPIVQKAVEASKNAFAAAKEINQQNRLARAGSQLASEYAARISGEEVKAGALSGNKPTLLSRLLGTTGPKDSQLDARVKELSKRLTPDQQLKLSVEGEQLKAQNAQRLAQVGQSRLFAASFAIPVITGAASTAFREQAGNGESRDTPASKFISDTGQAVSTGLSIKFLSSVFSGGTSGFSKLLARASGPAAALLTTYQIANAAKNIPITRLKNEAQDISIAKDKRDKSQEALVQYNAIRNDIIDAKRNDLPDYKIRELESKQQSALYKVAPTSLKRIREAATERDKERVISEEQLSTDRSGLGSEFSGIQKNRVAKGLGEAGLSFFSRRFELKSQFGSSYLTREELGGDDYSGEFRQFGQGIKPFDLVSDDGKKSKLAETALSILKQPSKQRLSDVKGNIESIKNALKDSGYESSLAGFDELKNTTAETAAEAIEQFVIGVATTTESTLKEKLKQPIKEDRVRIRKEFLAAEDAANSKISRESRSISNNQNSRDLILSLNSYLTNNRLETGAISAEDATNINFGGKIAEITAKTASDVEKTNNSSQKEILSTLSTLIEKFPEISKTNILSGFSNGVPLEQTISSIFDELNNQGQPTDKFDELVKPIRDIAENNLKNVEDIKKLGSQSIVGSNFEYYQQLSKDKLARQGELDNYRSNVLGSKFDVGGISPEDLNVENLRNKIEAINRTPGINDDLRNYKIESARFEYEKQNVVNQQARKKEREQSLSGLFGNNLVDNLTVSSSEITRKNKEAQNSALNLGLVQKTTSEFLNKPEYLFTAQEKELDLVRKQEQEKRFALNTIDQIRNNPAFLPLGPNATQAQRDAQDAEKDFSRGELVNRFDRIGNFETRRKTLDSLGTQFSALTKYQIENPGKSYSFGNPELQRDIAEKIRGGDFSGARETLSVANQDAFSEDFKKRNQGTSYGENIPKLLTGLNEIISRAESESKLQNEISKTKAAEILPYSAGDKTNQEATSSTKTLEDIYGQLSDIANKFGEKTQQETKSKIELLLGVNFDPSKLFNNDKFIGPMTALVSSIVNDFISANSPTNTPPIVPP